MAKTKKSAELQARAIVNKWVAGAVAVSWVPGSTLVLGTADYAMIRAVAGAFDVKHYDYEATVAVVACCVTGQGAAELLDVLPGLGWAIKAIIAGVLTKGAGEAVIAYFADRSPLT